MDPSNPMVASHAHGPRHGLFILGVACASGLVSRSPSALPRASYRSLYALLHVPATHASSRNWDHGIGR
eukprot:405190-Prymnesium_polylepis.1